MNLADEIRLVNVYAFSMVVRAGEGTLDHDGYRRIFTGRLFSSYADHPRTILQSGALRSDAAGAYQIMSYTWREIQAALQLPDFSPQSQDIAFVWLVKEKRKALDDVKAGRFQAAVQKCAREWASLPGSPYGQPMKTMQQAMDTYKQYGGTYAPSSAYNAKRPTLQQGNQGVDVAELQALLVRAGASITIDGKFGAVTDQALKAFQRAKGLLADGLAGGYTWAALETARHAPA